MEKGRRETCAVPRSSREARRKYSYSAPPARNLAAAPKLFFAISSIIVARQRAEFAGNPKVPRNSDDLPYVLPQSSPGSNWRGDDRVTLAGLVERFDRDAAGSRKLIREMLEAGPQTFLESAVAVLRERPESRGSQFVITLLVAHELLLATVCDPSLDRGQALALARAALQVDSMADMTMAKGLVNRAPETAADPGRLMDILDEISDGTRILPSLLRLLRHANPHVRSKAARMTGRGSRGVRWVERRLADEDPRVRANAIESMWGLDSPEARALLHGAMRDPNNRVAGNAILGLYMLGDCSTIPEMLHMAASDAAVSRSTAAWLMGETGDPRFVEVVAERLRETDPMVRKRAFWALSRIKTAAAKVAQTAEWRMAGRFRLVERGGKTRRMRVAVASADGKELPAILPTQFLLTEDGHGVNLYQVTERELPPALSVAFVFPESAGRVEPPWVKGALHALQWKRNSDLWALAPYLAGAGWQYEPQKATAGEAVFGSAPDAIRANFLRPTTAPACPDLWTAIRIAVRGQDRLVRGERRVIVFSGVEEGRAAGSGLISSVITSSTLVQVISTEDNPGLEEFCLRTRGLFRHVGGEEAAAAIEQAYLQLLARYEISYQTACPQARNLKIRAHTPSGWAEVTLGIPPPAEARG